MSIKLLLKNPVRRQTKQATYSRLYTEYRGKKLAVVEAKILSAGEGVAQAKLYATKLHLPTTYSTNGKEIYQICLNTGKEGIVDRFTPEELWNKSYPSESETDYSEEWRDRFPKSLLKTSQVRGSPDTIRN